ncbi:hypothetical protein [Corynebacterium sp.]|uniref:hypothetical protein n=1 Tax=Corynebacterium sp. TaxID=1720 RepID=UPI0026DC8572|nr:hypothetical protein [Corynebacterium sp.]MDO4914822.1 hypothetical protein [Corynebacterium sp.]
MIGQSAEYPRAIIDLLDGRPKGRIKAQLEYRNTVMYVTPRDDVKRMQSYDFINNPGVYFLIGPYESKSSPAELDFRNEVYIGQVTTGSTGKSFTQRINRHSHNKDKDFWTHVIVAFDIQPSFRMSEGSLNYAERRLIKQARDARRYMVNNGNDGNNDNASQGEKWYLESSFLAEVKLLLPLLGYNFLETVDDASESLEVGVGSEKLILSSSNYGAFGQRVPEGFVVYKGATFGPIAKTKDPTRSEKIERLRKHYGVSGNRTLSKDCLLDSPTQAAEFVSGYHMSGPLAWRSEANGKTLSELDPL